MHINKKLGKLYAGMSYYATEPDVGKKFVVFLFWIPLRIVHVTVLYGLTGKMKGFIMAMLGRLHTSAQLHKKSVGGDRKIILYAYWGHTRLVYISFLWGFGGY